MSLWVLLLWMAGLVLAGVGESRADVLPEPPPLVGSVPRSGFEGRPTLYSFDGAGVIRTYRNGFGWYYNPTIVATYTLSLYGAWYRGDATAYGPMLDNADWLYANAVERQDHVGRSFWTYEFAFPLSQYVTPAGWRSALTAAETISALYAVAQASNRPTLAERAADMLLPFEVLMRNGGYRTILADRRTVWFEEVAHPQAPSTRILNGHMYAVIALDWYGRHAPSAQAQTLAKDGRRGLQYILPLFDDRGFSLYDLYTRARICGYHRGHVTQLKQLYTSTRVDLFDIYALRWGATSC
jgi:D-glucuronyl C5-epimerase-like protein